MSTDLSSSPASPDSATLLPPPMRGAPARQMVPGAARGVLELPVCEDCGTVQYPVRELCCNCLSPRLQIAPVACGGTLLATTRLHHSNHAYFRPLLPLRIGSILLDAGPRVLAFLSADCTAPEQRVTVRCGLDGAGQAVLSATLASLDTSLTSGA